MEDKSKLHGLTPNDYRTFRIEEPAEYPENKVYKIRFRAYSEENPNHPPMTVTTIKK